MVPASAAFASAVEFGSKNPMPTVALFGSELVSVGKLNEPYWFCGRNSLALTRASSSPVLSRWAPNVSCARSTARQCVSRSTSGKPPVPNVRLGYAFTGPFRSGCSLWYQLTSCTLASFTMRLVGSQRSRTCATLMKYFWLIPASRAAVAPKFPSPCSQRVDQVPSTVCASLGTHVTRATPAWLRFGARNEPL